MSPDAPRAVAPADVERYRAAAIEMAAEARRIVLPGVERGFAVETKSDASPVTELDQAVERRLRELIARWFPDHGVIGEEYPPTRPESALQWIMDPIDGTAEFIHGIPLYGLMLALHHQGAPLVGVIDHPALDLLVHAGVGLGTFANGRRIRLEERPPPAARDAVRLVLTARINFTRHANEGRLFEILTTAYGNHRIYRAAYAHTVVVTGGADAMVAMHNHVWDLAATQVLVEEAGGRYAVVRDFVAGDGARRQSAVFGQPAVVADVVALLGPSGSDPGAPTGP